MLLLLIPFFLFSQEIFSLSLAQTDSYQADFINDGDLTKLREQSADLIEWEIEEENEESEEDNLRFSPICYTLFLEPQIELANDSTHQKNHVQAPHTHRLFIYHCSSLRAPPSFFL